MQVMVFSDCNYIDDTDEEVSTPVSKKAANQQLKEPSSNFRRLDNKGKRLSGRILNS